MYCRDRNNNDKLVYQEDGRKQRNAGGTKIVRICYDRGCTLFSSPEHDVLKMSYCDRSMSVAHHAASTICSKNTSPTFISQYQPNFTGIGDSLLK